MTGEIIQPKTRKEFREYFVTTSLRIIEETFDSAEVPVDLDFDPGTLGQRRTLVEQYYHTIDFTDWQSVRKLLKVYEDVLLDLDSRAEAGDDDAKQALRRLTKNLQRDGFNYVGGRLVRIGESETIKELSDIAQKFSSPVLEQQIDRIRNSIESDPSLAVGTSKELVETTCKTILSIREVGYDDNADVDTLVKLTRKTLQLLPEDISENAKGSNTIRRLLSGLGTITKGLSEIRNLYGTGHGKDGRARGIMARHAKLAVGAATTLSLFLWETHQARG